MTMPRVSVVVPAFNQCSYLRDALGSALAQTMSDLEVVVVDDGSTDATRAVCESFADSRVRYVHQRNDGTKGIGARNHAMLAARGEWIAVLDQDDVWAPTKLRSQLELAADQTDVGAVFCRVRFIDGAGAVTGQQQGHLPQGDVFHDLLAANRFYASSGIFRRSLLPLMGLPHESVGLADWYLWTSVARHARVCALDDALVDYRQHEAGYQASQLRDEREKFLLDHWKLILAIEPRLHIDCPACRKALDRLRRFVAQQQIDLARTALLRGDFGRRTRDALHHGWNAERTWLIHPIDAVHQSLRLLAAAAAGLLRRRIE